MDGLPVGMKFAIGQWQYEVVTNDGKGDCAIRLLNPVNVSLPELKEFDEAEEAPKTEKKHTNPFTKTKG